MTDRDRVTDAIENAAPISGDWPQPEPLPTMPPVEKFDPEMLPDGLCGWVMDIAHRMQCPPDFAAVGATVALSSLIGARAVVQPKACDASWRVVPNLWGLLVGNPGSQKSPALKAVLKPLHGLETAEHKRGEAARADWEFNSSFHKLRVAAAEGEARKKLQGKTGNPAAARDLLEQIGSAPAEPIERRFIVNDATVEKLGEILAVNPWGLLAFRDELAGLFADMEKKGRESDRAFYLTAYDGDAPYTVDRILRGTVRIPRVCLALVGGIQPGRLQQHVCGAMAGGSGDDGLLQRFGLTVWPDIAGEFSYVDRLSNSQAEMMVNGVFERLSQLQPNSEGKPVVWQFDTAAQPLFKQWYVLLMTELRAGGLHPALAAHLAKLPKTITALALIFALVDTPHARAIGERELHRALRWYTYLRSHAVRLYSAATMPETGAATALLGKILDGALGMSFTPRLVAKKGWAGLTTSDAVSQAAGVLVEHGWLRCEHIEPGASGGRPSEVFVVNPRAWEESDTPAPPKISTDTP